MATAEADECSSRNRRDQKEVTVTVGTSRAEISPRQRQLSPRFVHHSLPSDNTRQGIISPGWEHRAEAAQTLKEKSFASR